ncbi:MAG: MYG1 family protein [Candidatus Lokiarchaeota archaeon]
MTKIITHSGRVHFDDFFSVCLILHKDKNVDTIIRTDNLTAEEMNDDETWIVDIGGKYESDKKLFDHHQDDIHNDCAFSLLLKSWNIYEKAIEVYPWIENKIEWDEKGGGYVLEKYNIKNYEMIYSFKSFPEDSLKEFFQRKKRFLKQNNNDKFLMSIMRNIGKAFFIGMKKHKKISKHFNANKKVIYIGKNGVQSEDPDGIPCIFYLTSKPCYGSQLSNIFYQYKKLNFPNASSWITVYRYDRPENSIYIKRHGDPNRINLSTLQDRGKGYYAHKKGFMAVVEDMPSMELAHYIQSAL